MSDILIEGLHFGYTADKVVDDLSLSIEKGELVAILGENGSGKSTLLKLMLGQLKPQKGKVKLLGTDVDTIKSFRQIGYVPQVQSINQIAFPITVLELVVLNLYEDFGFFKTPQKTHKEKAIRVLKEMGLGEYINAPFNELSGGLKQRAMIARAMLNKPQILILDEPTAGVDKESKVNFLKLINRMNKENSITTVIVTHELELIKENLGLDKAFRMDEGRLLNVGV